MDKIEWIIVNWSQDNKFSADFLWQYSETRNALSYCVYVRREIENIRFFVDFSEQKSVRKISFWSDSFSKFIRPLVRQIVGDYREF